MRNPRVFLSHSGADGLVGEVLTHLFDALGEAGFEPLLDREHIMLGTNFPAKVDEFIETCDAAVFVISPRALKRKHSWVFAEANRLHQQMTHGDFQAIPVLIEGVIPLQLDAHWQAAGLSQQNSIVGGDPVTIAAQVVETLAYTRDVVQAEALAVEIAEVLEGVSDRALRNASQKLGDGWIVGDLRLQIGRRLLAAADEQIVAFAVALASGHLNKARTVLRLALPFTWIDRKVAQNLCATILEERRPAALCTARSSMAEYHIQCGWTSFPFWELKPRGEWLEGEEPERMFDETLRDLGRGGGSDDDELMQAFITDVVLAYDFSVLDVHVVGVLEQLAQLSGVGVVVLARDRPWDPEVSERIPRLRPKLDPDGELRALQRLEEARTTLERTYSRAMEIRNEVPRDG